MGYLPEKNGYRRNRAFRRKARWKANKRRLDNIRYGGYKPSLGSDGGGYWKGAQNSRAQKFLKKKASKAARRCKHIGQHGKYKRTFNYVNEWY